jgi:hypothetical protein
MLSIQILTICQSIAKMTQIILAINFEETDQADHSGDDHPKKVYKYLIWTGIYSFCYLTSHFLFAFRYFKVAQELRNVVFPMTKAAKCTNWFFFIFVLLFIGYYSSIPLEVAILWKKTGFETEFITHDSHWAKTILLWTFFIFFVAIGNLVTVSLLNVARSLSGLKHKKVNYSYMLLHCSLLYVILFCNICFLILEQINFEKYNLQLTIKIFRAIVNEALFLGIYFFLTRPLFGKN